MAVLKINIDIMFDYGYALFDIFGTVPSIAGRVPVSGDYGPTHCILII
jgi:hypothetical protein